MPDRVWYYASGGQRHGPVKTAELKRLATAGELRPSDLVWTDNMANWSPANTVKGLFAAEQVSPLPTPAQTPAATEVTKPAAAERDSGLGGETSEQLPAVSDYAPRASHEAASAVRELISDPWGRLGAVYQQLGPKRAMMVGGAFVAVFALCCLLAIVFQESISIPGVAVLQSTDAVTIVKTLIVLIGYVAALIGAVTLIRIAAKTGADFAADLFVVGAALLPLGAFAIIAGLLNPLSAAVQWMLSVLFVFAAVTAILMLYNGLSKVVRLSERMSALAVPAVLAAAMTVAQLLAWLLMRA